MDGIHYASWCNAGTGKKIHLENRVWGGGFATVIIACVVLNQVSGPPLFRLVMEWVGEAGNAKRRVRNLAWPKATVGSNGLRDSKRVLIFQGGIKDGILPEIQSMILNYKRIHTRVVGIEDLSIAGLLPADDSNISKGNDLENALEDQPLLDQHGRGNLPGIVMKLQNPSNCFAGIRICWC